MRTEGEEKTYPKPAGKIWRAKNEKREQNDERRRDEQERQSA